MRNHAIVRQTIGKVAQGLPAPKLASAFQDNWDRYERAQDLEKPILSLGPDSI